MSRPNDRQSTPNRCDFDQLVVQHLPAALGLALRLTNDANVAEDLVQEALCRALRQWQSYRGESTLKTWLLQIVVNADRDRRRREQLRRTTTGDLPAEEIPSHAHSAHQQLAADELSTQIRDEIDRLPDRQREVALLSFGEGLTADQVAELLQTTTANVHTCLHLARKRIATAISFADAEPK